MRDLIRLLFILGLALLVIPSCVKEGPVGLTGADGADGVDGADGRDGADGTVECLVCHSGDAINAKRAEFAMSVHKSGVNAVDYAGGRQSCAHCHSHEGFVQYAEFGKILGDISNPSAWKCGTCHGVHETFESTDYALRLTDPVVAVANPSITMDLGGSNNLCANCHQTRRARPVDEDQYSRGKLIEVGGNGLYRVTSSHYGPHHGPQSALVLGIGFAEIPGSVTYPEVGSSFHLEQASCLGCHMAVFSNGQGGHSWTPNQDACNTCHGVDEDNFNYGGTQSNTHAQLDELRDKLVELGIVEYHEEGEWIWDPETGEHIEVDIEGEYHVVPGLYPLIQVEAFFNWIGLDEDRSLGVHNPKYANALLTNTLEALE